MDWLNEIIKDYVTEEGKREVMEKVKKYFPRNAVPLDKFKNVNKELMEYKSKLKESYDKINELVEIDKELAEVKSQYQNFKEDIEIKEVNRKKQSILEKKLVEEGVNPELLDLITNTVNLGEISLNENGELDGIQEKLLEMKASKPSIFKTEIFSSKVPQDRKSTMITKEDFYNMDYNEKVNLFNENKELYYSYQEQFNQ